MKRVNKMSTVAAKLNLSKVLVAIAFLLVVALPMATVLSSATVWADPTPQCAPTHPEKCDSTDCATDAQGTWIENDKNNAPYCYVKPATSTGTGSFASPARGCNAKPKFLTLVPWYQYLTLTDDGTGGCKITNFDNNHVLGKASPFLLIALAILDDLIRVAAIVALGFVIYGGIQYITSQGSPDSTKRAQQTIINALIGLVLALVAAGLVGFIGDKLG